MSKIGFCIGNGESRQDYDLSKLSALGDTYGSNAVYRDNEVDHLICCDKRMVRECLLNNYTKPIYTRPEWYGEFRRTNVYPVPQHPWEQKLKWMQTFHWGSGLHAVHLAIKHGCNWLVMLGHDMQKHDGKHNNIYKGTHNYEDADHHAIEPSFWIKQFELLFETYPNRQYLFVNDQWELPFEKTYSNVSVTDYKGFENDINQS
jgi:hypothetical protein